MIAFTASSAVTATAAWEASESEAIEQHLTARLARQSLLIRKNPCVVFSFIIEESALHRVVGGTTVLKEQLERLRDSVRLRNVEVQVMPTQLAAHSGVNGQMVLLETLERRQFVCIEAQGIVSIRSDQDEVSEFWLRYGMLRSQALHTEESARLIEHMAGEL
ncbi:DUF5753 domain-containing protein [Streptomyces clavifer]|uniref:DUF5753 domain-containing protein n=1 Tax=Streptomyces clavifer TaxID=68188 RepID=UPI0037F17F4A